MMKMRDLNSMRAKLHELEGDLKWKKKFKIIIKVICRFWSWPWSSYYWDDL